ncbi:MAG: sigma-54 dependent transcriptional regulator [Zoogloeaceae bacterium]|jgi:DNA-binding NtrC family response regulator|nr:sigma-54 dependent transcriptional regulator [Zoogloeaceae bacterium]
MSKANANASSASPAVLIIDDQAVMRRTLEILFRKEGYRVTSSDNGTRIQVLLEEFRPDVIVTDVRMEPVSGIDVLRQVRILRPTLPVIFMTAFGTIAIAVEAMKLGAVDFLTKPFKNEDLLFKVECALESSASRPEDAPTSLEAMADERDMVASSPALRAVLEQVGRIAGSNLTVLVTGETGTGKSMLAHEIHRRSPRATGPFIPINGAALPEPLLESELFGYEKGAFTGATASRAGLFEVAEGGTIFLDEIGTLPANLQAKLLGVLQDRQIRRVGGHRIISVNTRFIAATNIDLEQSVRRGEFRQDLYYRLNVARIRMPPLREHREDIPYILREMLSELSVGRPFRYAVSPEALELINRYPFPGNVRELRNAIEWAVTVAKGSMIEAGDLPQVMRFDNAPMSLESAAGGRSLAEMERNQIASAIEAQGGNLTEVARTLGIGRTTLWRKMREYGLKK